MDPNPFFRDRKQAAAAARRLLGTVGLSHLFDEAGPTPEAARLRDRDELTGDARLVLLTVWSLWNGEGGPKMRELRMLSEPVRSELAFLMQAIETGPAAVDAWLEMEDAGPAPAGGFTGGGIARA